MENKIGVPCLVVPMPPNYLNVFNPDASNSLFAVTVELAIKLKFRFYRTTFNSYAAAAACRGSKLQFFYT